MGVIKIEREEYKRTSTTLDCGNLINNSIVIKIPRIKGKFFKRVKKIKNDEVKDIIKEMEL